MVETLGPRLSVVVPCYNESECLRELHRRASAACRAETGDDYEIVLINDGSGDDTWLIMRELAATDPHLVCIDLARNHGHQLALTAGLSYCRGELILIIDADLQDPPELLTPMLETLRREEADVVYARRRSRAGESHAKKATAAAFYRLLRRFTDVDIPADTGDFRLITRRALDVFLAMPESYRFVRGMVAWIGMKQVAYAYDRDSRYAGVTKYSLAKMLKLTLAALTGFSTVPLKLASWLGLVLGGLSLLLLGYTLVSWMTGETVAGWTSLMVVVLVISSAQMFVLGILGEYLGQLYMEAKRRPLFVVRRIVAADVGVLAPRGTLRNAGNSVERLQAAAPTGRAELAQAAE